MKWKISVSLLLLSLTQYELFDIRYRTVSIGNAVSYVTFNKRRNCVQNMTVKIQITSKESCFKMIKECPVCHYADHAISNKSAVKQCLMGCTQGRHRSLYTLRSLFHESKCSINSRSAGGEGDRPWEGTSIAYNNI